jgi:hypothetical protein
VRKKILLRAGVNVALFLLATDMPFSADHADNHVIAPHIFTTA